MTQTLDTHSTCATSRVIVGVISTGSTDFLLKQAHVVERATVGGTDLFLV